MAITRSSAADRVSAGGRRPVPGTGVSRALESYLLLASSLVIGVGLALVYQARSAQWSESTPLDLNQVNSADQLVPVLAFMSDPEDRLFAARAIYQYLGQRGSLESVSQLRNIQVSAAQRRSTRGLSRYTSRTPEDIALLTGTDLRQLEPLVAVRTPRSLRWSLAIAALVFFLPFYAAHIAWRTIGFGGDMILLPLVHVLSGFGFLLMARLRDPLRDALLFPDFTAGVAIGCVVLFACSLPDYERSSLRRLAYMPLAASFLVSLVLLVFGSGPGVSDAKVNLRLGPLSVQPVEIIKVLLILFLAGYFANRWEFFRELKEPSSRLPRLLSGLNLPRLQYAAPVALAVALAIIFFFLQKDLGPALVLSVVFLTLYAVARSRATGVLIGFAALVGAFWFGYVVNFPRTVASRVSIWLSPWDNFVPGGGDHLAQSLWTFASGGLFGAGLGLGSPESLPAVHTDLILAAVGEELGFAGLAAIYVVYALLVHRAFRIALSAQGYYTLFLSLGFALLLGFQVVLISGGVLGLTPLSGVVTPFLNYGKSSTVVHFAIVGILLAASVRPETGERGAPFRRPVSWVLGLLAVLGVAILIQAARLQVFASDRTMGTGTLVLQGDGQRRYVYNPRLVEAGERIVRGSILDRNGIPLATSSQALLDEHRADYQRLGITLERVTASGEGRKYPFAGLTFHLLGDLRTRINWGAPNTSFVERDVNATLQGYDDRATVVNVSNRPDGPVHQVVHRDLRELVPLVRYRHRPGHDQVQRILQRDRDVRTTIDIRLQREVARLLEQHVRVAQQKKGAAIVIDPATGNLLASATYPWAGASEAVNVLALGAEDTNLSGFEDSLFDRPRYGLYPPGSSFKLVTAAAALQVRDNVESETFECKRLSDGRIGNAVRGWSRPVRDDILDTAPHGKVNMAAGIVHSCNAYFAQLGTYVVGAESLLRMADYFGIRVASPNTPAQLRDALPQAAYGQGQVVATPLQMARVAAAVCNGGKTLPVRWVPGAASPPQQVMPVEHTRLVGHYMRRVVREGTGRAAGASAVPIAGKTGTAELRNQPSHAWFVGFAPYSASAGKKIAFAVIVENGRYGGRVAAPLAAEIVSAAARLGLVDRE